MKKIIIMLLLVITATGYTQKKAGTPKQTSKNITKSNPADNISNNSENKAELLPFRRIDKKIAADSIATTPEQQFITDFNNKTLRLYVLGGIAAVITTKDKEFAQKSGFTYHDFGCLAPPDLSYYETYNRLVLDHLKLNLKAGWQKEITANTIGFQNWKERQ